MVPVLASKPASATAPANCCGTPVRSPLGILRSARSCSNLVVSSTVVCVDMGAPCFLSLNVHDVDCCRSARQLSGQPSAVEPEVLPGDSALVSAPAVTLPLSPQSRP